MQESDQSPQAPDGGGSACDAPATESRGTPQAPDATRPGLAVVAVGASAGALTAFQELLSVMPADTGAAFVLLQHLAPTHKSLSRDLLQPQTTMPVVEVEEGVALEANRVFLLPPNRFMTVDNGRLRLTPPGDGQAVRLPIDVFLRSLAEERHERAVAIILTGGGADGAQGIRSIVAQGGLVLAQDPATAEHDSMPKSAIQTGVVDRVLTLSQMPDALLQYIRHAYARQARGEVSVDSHRDLQTITRLLKLRTGHDFSRYKEGTLVRRIQRRMSLRRLEQMHDYAEAIQNDEPEIQSLLRDLLIGVTCFFREPKAWEFLAREVIAPLVQAKPAGSVIRIWVAGCSTGEEAYTLAMLMLENVEATQKHLTVEIFASDVNRQALEFARTGVYAPLVAQDLTPARLERWFVASPDQQSYRVSPQLRASVVFAEQNLLTDPPFSRLDLITCRNLLIYLEPETQERVLGLFHFALLEGGHLFLGNAETVGRQDDLFAAMSKPHQVYRRVGSTRYDRVSFPIQVSDSARPGAQADAALPPPLPTKGGLTAWAQQLVLARHTRACVLVNARHQILCLFGPTQRYLHQPVGPLTGDLLAWVPEELRPQLRTLLHQAHEQRQAVTTTGVRINPGDPALVQLTAEPVKAPGQGEGLFLVVLEPPPADAVRSSTGEAAAVDAEPLVGQLERELQVTKESLQSTIQELEGTNEGLKAANEEVTSMNEELRSVNEELETSKEELQSLNEELRTVNQQLQAKMTEAERTSDDLRNILTSTDLATLFLDRELRIRQFTPAMTKLLNLIPSDLGRPLADFAGPFANADLHAQARQVLEQLVPAGQELQTPSGRWYLRRVLPYRTGDNRIDGAVVTFTEITAQKQAEARLQTFNQALEQRVAERTSQLRNLTTKLIQSEQDERRKLASALHDTLQQLLVAAKMRVNTMGENLTSLASKATIREVDDLLGQCISESRSLTAELAPPILFDAGLNAALKWLARWVQEKHGLEVHVAASDERLQTISMDRRVFIFQSVRELLFNIVKHAGLKQARVEASFIEPAQALVVVSDQGVGFNAHVLEQTPSATVGGQGLFGIRERLKLLGGRMEVTSALGQGTHTTLSVPLPDQTTQPLVEDESADAGEAGQAALRGATPQDRVIRVLLVDDHQVVRGGLAELLRQEPDIVIVGEAGDGLEGIERARELRPDVVVMDVNMPRMNGIAATRRLREELPGVRVVGLSMHGAAEYGKAMVEAGAAQFLSKGGTSEALITAIRHAAGTMHTNL